MHRKLASSIAVIALFFGICVSVPNDALGQEGSASTVSMVTLQTMPGRNGQQMVVTPRGKVVQLPGAGVNSNVVQIFIGSQGGYWYVDKNGQQVDLTQAAQAMQAYQGNAQTAQVPQYAPAPPVTNNYYDQGGGSGGSAMGTAVAAGLGAATGAAITNAAMEPSYNYWHGVPYGMPVTYSNGAKPYYVNKSGNSVYVNNNDVDVNRNTANFNQANINTANVNRANVNTANVNRANVNTANVNTANVNRANVNSADINQYHASNLQQQQSWYNSQVSSKGGNYQNWQKQQDNPFVHPDAQQASGRFANNNQADGQRGGLFGRRGGGDDSQSGEAGGLLGRRGGGDDSQPGEGGLLSGRNKDGGGLAGRRGGGGGRRFR